MLLSGSEGGGDDFVQELFAAEEPCLRGDGDFPSAIAQVLARWSSPHASATPLQACSSSTTSPRTSPPPAPRAGVRSATTTVRGLKR